MNDNTTNLPTNEIPYGYCHCGCGQKTKIAERTARSKGHFKGEPLPFVQGHKGNKAPRNGDKKQCTKCGEFKPMTNEYFFSMESAIDGFKSECKECSNTRQKKRREENGDALRARQNELNALNREKLIQQGRARYAKKKEILNKRSREYKERNKDKISEYNRQYKINNREALRANEARRNARKRNAGGNHTAADVKQQYDSQQGKCYYCQIDVGNTYEVDHFIPLSRGGSNSTDNIVIACPSCNARKANKLPSEWSGSKNLPRTLSISVGQTE